jgi:hypothetical protein
MIATILQLWWLSKHYKAGRTRHHKCKINAIVQRSVGEPGHAAELAVAGVAQARAR